MIDKIKEMWGAIYYDFKKDSYPKPNFPKENAIWYCNMMECVKWNHLLMTEHL